MARSKFSVETRCFLEDRAGKRCEYCKASVLFIPHSFTIDHIIPISLDGSDDLSNLAYACFVCNRNKHDKTTAVDPFSQSSVAIFNPRIQEWNSHFSWDSSFIRILGLTAVGRATIAALKLNRPELIRMRKELIAVNRHPPADG